MPAPVVVPRSEHQLSRQQIDPDALRVLYRLHQFNYQSYLVGGSVRDLLLGRTPKDFDVGTDAHPYQIKKLFRNCFIIGRRFRLAHVRFGNKVVEVATFRRNIVPGTELDPESGDAGNAAARDEPEDRRIHHDNTFGTPEEDAFRRDFTVNALFYDIATFSIIDYVGGLQDLRDGVIRSIGDPRQRFQEDPVRMLRAVSFAARLRFRLDSAVNDALRTHAPLIATAAAARLVEEYYKVLRSGAAELTFRLLAEYGLLQAMTPELQRGASQHKLWPALAALDRYRQRHTSTPAELTNSVLLGTLIVPLGMMPQRTYPEPPPVVEPTDGRRLRRPPKEPQLLVGLLPIARRDTERLRQLLSLQRRLHDLEASPRAKRTLLQRSPFVEALAWLDIHGDADEVVRHWRELVTESGDVRASDSGPEEQPAHTDAFSRRPRRRRGRGRRRSGPPPPQE